MSLSESFLTLHKSIEEQNTWAPSIVFQSSHFQTTANGEVIPVSTQGLQNNVDVIVLLSSYNEVSHRPMIPNIVYPDSAVFMMEGFTGLNDTKRLIEHVKSSAALHGTVLNHKTYNKPSDA